MREGPPHASVVLLLQDIEQPAAIGSEAGDAMTADDGSELAQ